MTDVDAPQILKSATITTSRSLPTRTETLEDRKDEDRIPLTGVATKRNKGLLNLGHIPAAALLLASKQAPEGEQPSKRKRVEELSPDQM